MEAEALLKYHPKKTKQTSQKLKDEEEEKSPTPERNNNSISISTSDVHTSDEVGLMDKTLETLKTGEVFAKRRMERKESKFYSF